MKRKKFIETCCMACLGGTALATLLQSCTSANHIVQGVMENERLVIRKTEFEETAKGGSAYRQYVIAKTEKLNFPICIYRINEDNYSALLMECSHKGCELQPNGNFLVCPCHGSEFTNTGVVQNPPAEENLRTFKITTDNEHIYIHL